MSKIAVIGDVMLDRRIQCEIIGLSPEDDLTPKLKAIKESYSPGGAANVAANIISLGGKAFLYGAIGDDQSGHKLLSYMKGPFITDRPTTTKTRYVTPRGRHAVRIDEEEINPISGMDLEVLMKVIRHNLPYSIIIVSDYAKGVVTTELMEELHLLDIPIIVDPKGVNFNKYGNVLAITPNEIEAAKMVGDHSAEYLITTLGGQGCIVHDTESGRTTKISTRVREVGDPTGCGDSFIASLGLALSNGDNMVNACKLAVAAGSCAVDHEGVYAVTMDDLKRELGI